MAIILARVEGVSALMFTKCPRCGASIQWDEPHYAGQGRWTMKGRCRCKEPTRRIDCGLWDMD